MISHSDYIKEIKHSLPAKAFAPAPHKFWIMVMHLLIIILACAVIKYTTNFLWYPVCSLIIGHSLACNGFLAHELSHNTIVRNRWLRNLSEFFFWATLLMPSMVWRRVHNQMHHSNPNSSKDPDRQFLKSEFDGSATTRWYTWLFFPHYRSSQWKLIVGFNFLTYIARNTLAAFKTKKPSIVPFKANYSFKEKLRIVSEIFLIVLLQVALFYAMGGQWSTFIWASPVSYLIASCIVMAYIFTHHWLNPFCEENDPLVATTSVEVHSIIDQLHHNFSHHSEHHLFPSMNSDYYPEVSKILKLKFADRYNRIPITKAWSKLWKTDLFISQDK